MEGRNQSVWEHLKQGIHVSGITPELNNLSYMPIREPCGNAEGQMRQFCPQQSSPTPTQERELARGNEVQLKLANGRDTSRSRECSLRRLYLVELSALRFLEMAPLRRSRGTESNSTYEIVRYGCARSFHDFGAYLVMFVPVVWRRYFNLQTIYEVQLQVFNTPPLSAH